MKLTNQQFAQAIFEQRVARAPFSPFRPTDRVLDTAAAYDVQDELVALLRKARNADIVGYKIGLTSTAMQTMCGIDKPVFGRILSDQVYQSGARVDLKRYVHLGVEFEIAIKLGSDIVTNGSPLSTADIAARTAAICPALELVDDRHADYSALDACSLIADNAWNAGVVLADWQPLPSEFTVRQGRVFSQDRPAETGTVDYQHVLASVAWLAEELASRGSRLHAGDIVMTGSVVRTCFPADGELWRYEVDGLGTNCVNCGYEGAR
jgi:2-keto-4-pentenoate hydratase